MRYRRGRSRYTSRRRGYRRGSYGRRLSVSRNRFTRRLGFRR